MEDRVLSLDPQRVAWREVNGEAVILDLANGEYLSTAGSALELWKLLADGTSRPALAEHLVDRYAIDRALADRDVDAFVDDCERRGLLRPSAA